MTPQRDSLSGVIVCPLARRPEGDGFPQALLGTPKEKRYRLSLLYSWSANGSHAFRSSSLIRSPRFIAIGTWLSAKTFQRAPKRRFTESFGKEESMKLHLNLRNWAIPVLAAAVLMCMQVGAQGIQADSKDNSSTQLLAQASTPPAQPTPNPPKAQKTTKPVPDTPALREAWRKAILKTPRPKKDACFTANYPDKQWREVPCATPPHKIYPPPPRHGTKSATVGDGSTNDFSAQVTSGTIAESEGSFVATSNVTNECAVACTITTTGISCPTNPSCAGSASTNTYSLQLNSKPFYGTSACSGSPNGATAPDGCSGWEQFVYESAGSGFIQYWLEQWGPPAGSSGYKPCPSPHGTSCSNGSSNSTGWCEQALYGQTYCVVNAVDGTSPISEPISKIGDFHVDAYAASGPGTTDSLAVSVTGGSADTAPGNNYFPDLGSNWTEAEFNVFGDGNGDQAVFNAGSTLVVQTGVTSAVPTMNAPACVPASFTGESNNLSLAPAQGTTTPPVCCPYGGASPAIEFVESNNSTEWAACTNPITWGEPHITTVDGTYYDFQGAGEYVTLRDPDGTEVQVRQTPIPTDAPGNWVPNPPPAKYQNDGLVSCLSGNTAVAARVGKHRVTYEPSFGVSDPSGLQLRIDGKIATHGVNFGDGGSVETSSEGIEVHFPDGKILSVSGSLPLLSLEFSGLGVVSKTGGAPEVGLAGVVPDDNWLPRLPNGASVGPMPPALHDRYITLNKTFGNAWRVTGRNSLFDYAPGASTATFTNAAWPVENAKTCSLPNKKTTPHINVEAAEEACKSITNATLHSSCVFDVQMTGITRLVDTYVVTERVLNKLAVKPIVIKPDLADIQ
jgi:hypothetical protein